MSKIRAWGLPAKRNDARDAPFALLGQRGDQFQQWDLARRQVRRRILRALADIRWYRTAALYVVNRVVQGNRTTTPRTAQADRTGCDASGCLRDPANPSGIGQFAVIQAMAPPLGMEVIAQIIADSGRNITKETFNLATQVFNGALDRFRGREHDFCGRARRDRRIGDFA
jgi:hypothetical protein